MIDQPITTVHPYAKRLAAPLKRLGIATVRDLLQYTPTRHEDLREVIAIREVRTGQRAVFRGRIITIANRRSFRRRMLLTEALVSDTSGTIRCVWFQQPYLAHAFRSGDAVIIAGVVESDTYGLHVASPVIERDQPETLHAGRLVPIYPLTYGISQKQLRLLINAALPATRELSETLPEEIYHFERLLPIGEAIRQIHFPSDADTLERARTRLAFEEIFTYFLRVRASRADLETAQAPRIPSDDAVEFIASLPFSLTNAQRRAVSEIQRDLARQRPMQRLLNGDVGSGKTVVAAIAALAAARSGFQTAYLAPTEVLAVQQAQKFSEWLIPLGVHVALWTRTSRTIDGAPATPNAMRAAVRGGSAAVVIGTHAILSPNVRFHALGLAIIDEQHRFGVEQRAALRTKAASQQPQAASRLMPHLLSMTATPIPRTLNLSLFGDLDVSVLDELPPGRRPARTVVIGPADRLTMTREIRGEIDRGHQVFVVCPQIDAEEGASVTAAVAEACERAHRAFPGVVIGELHGKMRKDAQAAVMGEFAAGRLAVLVATTVIEVGVDQPNATVMVIEDAERFGLAQLHQLRGRVGRGGARGTCFFTTRSEDPSTLARLRRVAACTDGFRIAEMDLKERGPGAVIGTAQSGWPAFRYAVADPALYQRAQRAAARFAPRVRETAIAHLE